MSDFWNQSKSNTSKFLIVFQLANHVIMFGDSLKFFWVFFTLQAQHYCLWHLKIMLLNNQNGWHWKCSDVHGAKNGLEALSAESVNALIAWHMSVNTTDISLIPYHKLEIYIPNYLFIAELSTLQLLYFLVLPLYFFF